MDLNPKMLEIMGTIAAVGNVILRITSTQPIETPVKRAKETIRKAEETAKEYNKKFQVEADELKQAVKALKRK